MTRYVLGVDPGQTTGIARVDIDNWCWDLLQVTPGAVLEVVRALADGQLWALAVEQFVVGPRAAKLSTPAAAELTRVLIGKIAGLGGQLGVPVLLRSAAAVKPWASDKRLTAAGVPEVPGTRHARDGARHACFAAVHDLGCPDPLSTRFRRSLR